MVSLIIPVYNEKANIRELLARIRAALNPKYKDYEVIFIDDHSTDGTFEYLAKRVKDPHFKVFSKVGQKGKAFSLIEGFEKANGDLLVMIDADLQYPPEAIVQMVEATKRHDVVVTNRSKYLHSKARKYLSRIFKFAFGKLLFSQDVDIQSGLKVFKRRVWQTVKFSPSSPWTFDLEFLHRAKQAGFAIASHDITFDYRKNGHSKIGIVKTGLELTKHAISLKFKKINPAHIPPFEKGSMLGAGIGYRAKKFITHTTLHHSKSAIQTLTSLQKVLVGSIFVALFAALFINAKSTAIGVVGLLTTVYFIDVLFNAFLITKSLNKSPDISFTDEELNAINDERLPIYTILCPLYKEADVLPQFIASIESLDWPKDKLEVLLLLEEDDIKTQEVAQNLYLPDYFKIVVVPKSNPKTKPKACNYGLHLAHGKYLVIYDAEDRPDYLQLKKAYLAFKKFGYKIACFQAKLNYYNTYHNLLTKFFTAEYSLWFGLILTGLQSINTAIPLGGTSNHFRTSTLRWLEGWDPFNVTEDCDLGVRLFKEGYQTAIIDSITLEEANSEIKNWLRQRSRWIKGYLQTYLVHSRDLPTFFKNHTYHAAIFQLVVGGKIAFILINPIMWLTTISYFVLRPVIGPTIEQFFPTPIFYTAVFCLVVGNFLYLYYYMIALVRQERFNLVKYILFVPVYWVAISTAFWIAAYQLIAKPHYWEKTVHGLHFEYEEKQKAKEERCLNAAIASEKRARKIRSLISSGTAAAGVLIAATVFGNFINFLYNAYLGRTISVEDFGLVSLIGSFLFLAIIVTSALSRTVTHKSAYFLGKYGHVAKQFWAHTRIRAILFSLAATAIWLLATPFLAAFFHASSWVPFFLFAPVWLIGTAAAVDGGFLGGILKFKILSILIVSEAISKFIFAILFVETGYSHYVYAAIPLSMTVSFLIGWIFARAQKETKLDLEIKEIIKFPINFFVTSTFTKISTVVFLSFDLILAKHFLPPKEAGEYALLSLTGKMIFLVGGLFGQFITPLVSKEEGAERSSHKIFYKLLFASTSSSLIAYLAVGIFGSLTVPILFGSKVQPILYLLPIYGLAILLFTVSNSIVTFYQTRNKHTFAVLSLVLAVIQVIGIYFYHGTLREIVLVMAAVGAASFVFTILTHFLYEPMKTTTKNIQDFFGRFTATAQYVPAANYKQKILIFNWRDTKHVWAGGAEVYIHEISKKLVEEGHKVTIFCSNDKTCSQNETIDGIEIIRRGGHYLVYIWAFLYYIFKFRGKYDVIIDSENGIPFFTPLFVRKPVIGLVHHIHLQEVFDRHLPWLLAKAASFLEIKAMPFVYRNIQMITVSKSSKEEMGKIGLGKTIPVKIVNPGVDLTKFKSLPKTKTPSILYLGRLKPYKSIDSLIQVFAKVVKKVPQATLTIAGEGESRLELEEMTTKLGLGNVVKFLGKVSEKAKARLYAESWVVAQPSKSEGWGITVIEANACGTPVVASDVLGLRDSVKNPHSGLLVTWDNKEKWTNALISVLTDEKQRSSLEQFSKAWARRFSWDKSAQKLLEVINEK